MGLTTDCRLIDNQVVGICSLMGKKKLNLIDERILETAAQDLRDLIALQPIRCIIMQGSSPYAFSGGVDLNQLGRLNKNTAKNFINKLHTFCNMIRELPVPVIAKISQASYRRSNFDESVINSLVKSHQSRIKNNKKFQHLVETEKRILEAQGKTTLSLVQSIRESEHEKNKKNQLAFENEFRFLHDLKPLTRVDSDGAENNEEEASDPYDEPKYDSLLMETGQIMIDFNNKLIEPNR